MEALYEIHTNLVEHTNAPVRRLLMDEIDWTDRLIGLSPNPKYSLVTDSEPVP